ncbi:hypothetical protein [Tardiphaga sp.]|uniref:hypothetical protein n=1 Tax=Tardiphaga sp. TaxID=1926292 RepID=UPI00260CC37B|nr:hypothetical protein [Tardiphaga sp.]MDB5619822.1 hypothetical protein [Tardiphaga sp.]
MTMNIEADAVAPDRPAMATSLLPWLALAALFAAAIWLRHGVAANTDVSWLLTAAEKVMQGGRLYVDVIETNPPMAVLVYVPAVWLALASSVPAEIVVDALMFVAIFASLAISARILKPSDVLKDLPRWSLALLGFAVLAILPAQTFGQREHIAVVALLPMLAVIARRMQRETPPRWAVVVAGLGAAIALSFKPQFAIGIGCAVAASCFHVRTWRHLFTPENLIAAVAAALYLAGTIVLYPEFFTVIMPMVGDVYLQVGLSPLEMIDRPAVSLWAIAMLAAWLLSRRGLGAPLLLLLSTSVGFAVVFLLQRKGWPYHSYPMLALALLGLGVALSSCVPQGRLGRVSRAGALLLLAALFARSMLWFDVAFDARPLQAAVARLGLRPVVLAISGEPGIGHPLVRALGGTWVSRQQGLWVAAYADHLRRSGPLSPDREAALDFHGARERAMLVEDIKRTPPTVVLVDDLTGHGSAWLAAHPDVADLLKDYRATETVNRVAILTRR